MGRLGLNPIYVDSPLPGGAHRLDLRFPSAWHAHENRGREAYHRPSVVLSSAIVDAVTRNTRSPAIDRLIAEFVVVGLPDRYRRTPRAGLDPSTPPAMAGTRVGAGASRHDLRAGPGARRGRSESHG